LQQYFKHVERVELHRLSPKNGHEPNAWIVQARFLRIGCVLDRNENSCQKRRVRALAGHGLFQCSYRLKQPSRSGRHLEAEFKRRCDYLTRPPVNVGVDRQSCARDQDRASALSSNSIRALT
jgi:hypothetical protein